MTSPLSLPTSWRAYSRTPTSCDPRAMRSDCSRRFNARVLARKHRTGWRSFGRRSGLIRKAEQPRQREAIVYPEFRDDLRHWVDTDRKLALRCLDLVDAVLRDPFSGIGKPEPLRYLAPDTWSRRLSREHPSSIWSAPIGSTSFRRVTTTEPPLGLTKACRGCRASMISRPPPLHPGRQTATELSSS
jgi:toxin YoeB